MAVMASNRLTNSSRVRTQKERHMRKNQRKKVMKMKMTRKSKERCRRKSWSKRL